MRRAVLGVVVGLCGLALIAPTAFGSGNPNAGDVWVDNVGQPAGPGHEMDPHLACKDINLWGNGLADTSGSFAIDGWPPSGGQELDYSGAWRYTAGSGDQVIAVIKVSQLIANAVANGDTPSSQGYHFKLQFSQDPQKHKTFWVDCQASPPPPPPPSSPATPHISTVASAGVTAGGQIFDKAILWDGSSPTGTITFSLYRASDTSCSSPLASVSTSVHGNGTYTSPAVTEATPGTYQWVASYSGDANNEGATASCNAADESVLVSPPTPSPPTPPGMLVVKAQKLAGSPSGFTTSAITAAVGQQVDYQMSVTNTGGVLLALSFSDPRCDPGTLSGPVGTLNPDRTLAPGKTVDYHCSHVITPADRTAGSFTNTVTIIGTPPSGPALTGTSSVKANVPKVVVKAVCSISRRNVQLTGVIGSKRRPFVVSVGSFGVKQVTFYLDGRKIATVKRPKHGKFSVRINPQHLSVGAHHVKATIKFSNLNCAGLSRAAVFVHPKPPVVVPNFTG